MGVSFKNEIKLEDYLVSKPRNGIYKAKEFLGSGIQLVKMGDLFSNRVITNNSTNYIQLDEDEEEKYLLESGELLFSRTSLVLDGVGRCSIVGKIEEKMVYESNLFRLRLDKNCISPSYIQYYFESYLGRMAIQAIAKQTAAASITANDLIRIPIKVHSLNEQFKIVKVLGDLDEKIEINNCIKKNLESMAQEIFKRWFVDFEFPNENGDPYKSSGGEMVESELGMIPKGWKVTNITQLMDSVSVRHKFPSDKIIFLNTSDIYDGEVLHNEYSVVSSLPGQAKKSIEKNDILYSEIRPQNKRFAFVNFDAKDFVVSTKLMVLRTKALNPALLYFLLTGEATISELQRMAESRSGTFPQITFDNLKYIKLAIPEDGIVNFAKSIFDSTLIAMQHLKRENKKLAELRDTILPKLMSGEIRIPIIDTEMQE